MWIVTAVYRPRCKSYIEAIVSYENERISPEEFGTRYEALVWAVTQGSRFDEDLEFFIERAPVRLFTPNRRQND